MNEENIKKLKELKELTGAPLGLCKEALENSEWDIEKAKKYLIKKGEGLLEKKRENIARFGIIEGYIHFNGRVGALVEMRAETDFVTKSEEFKKLAHEIALQVATMNPKYLKREDIKEEEIEEKKREFSVGLEDKPKDVKEKIIENKLEKWYEEVCLLDQNYIKDENIKIKDLINNFANKFGEKIELKRFVRLSIND
ncbi:MAG: elongation factor Ts [Minisyncoccia bacterium]